MKEGKKKFVSLFFPFFPGKRRKWPCIILRSELKIPSCDFHHGQTTVLAVNDPLGGDSFTIPKSILRALICTWRSSKTWSARSIRREESSFVLTVWSHRPLLSSFARTLTRQIMVFHAVVWQFSMISREYYFSYYFCNILQLLFEYKVIIIYIFLFYINDSKWCENLEHLWARRKNWFITKSSIIFAIL